MIQVSFLVMKLAHLLVQVCSLWPSWRITEKRLLVARRLKMVMGCSIVVVPGSKPKGSGVSNS